MVPQSMKFLIIYLMMLSLSSSVSAVEYDFDGCKWIIDENYIVNTDNSLSISEWVYENNEVFKAIKFWEFPEFNIQKYLGNAQKIYPISDFGGYKAYKFKLTNHDVVYRFLVSDTKHIMLYGLTNEEYEKFVSKCRDQKP